jgi:hypothetical protein
LAEFFREGELKEMRKYIDDYEVFKLSIYLRKVFHKRVRDDRAILSEEEKADEMIWVNFFNNWDSVIGHACCENEEFVVFSHLSDKF